MPVVFIPSLLRSLTQGADKIAVPGETVRQVIDNLEMRYPGIKDRLCQGEVLRPNLVVAVDGEISQERLRHRLTEASQVRFMPALSGGGGHSAGWIMD